jgi:AraC-like DNA-binding protein
MFASRGILDLYQMKEESEMLGLTDHDLNPAVMAENYVRDDALLLSGKATHLERLELWFDRTGMPDWFVVTKLPIVTTQSRFIGVMGMLRRASESDKQLPVFQTVARSVELIRRDYATPIRMADVAQKCGQSLRQLQRHFQSAFGTTPQEFLLRTRISAAIRLLEETRLSIEEIALRCGFVDASAFILHFRQRTNQTPRQYQRLHQASSKHAS